MGEEYPCFDSQETLTGTRRQTEGKSRKGKLKKQSFQSRMVCMYDEEDEDGSSLIQKSVRRSNARGGAMAQEPAAMEGKE